MDPMFSTFNIVCLGYYVKQLKFGMQKIPLFSTFNLVLGFPLILPI